MTVRRFEQCIRRFPQAKVLVVGDLILDHYIWGRVRRISPEAPVPVVHVDSESLRLGGAANVYNNIISLGGQAEIFGVIGSDESGQYLLKALRPRQRKRGGIVIEPDRPTSRKTRIIAHNQQVVRFDVEKKDDIGSVTQQQILRHIGSRIRKACCLVVSDYAKGVITAPLMSELKRLCSAHRVSIVVDPKVEHFSYYTGVTMMTPNHLEARQGAGLHGEGQESVEKAGHLLRDRFRCDGVLVTRGEKGMSLFESDGSSWHIPTVARQVYDVTGAGDTVVGTLALALGSGASMREASMLANQAAGLVVGMIGTATVTGPQLRDALQHASI